MAFDAGGRAFVQTSILMAAHGERGGDGDNEALAGLAEAVAMRLPGHAVAHGVLYGAPSIEHAAASLGGGTTLVYPLFFSGGRFVSEMIPERLAALPDGSRFAHLPPLGLDPRLAVWLAERIEATATARGFDPAATFVLIAAHGSTRATQPRDAAMLLAERLARHRRGAPVGFGFLDEPPYLRDAIARLPDEAVVVSLFSGRGLHAAEDLPGLAAAAGREDIPVIGPIGTDPDIAPLIAEAIRERIGAIG
ncbi:MAG TPA: CbiX/SirB N-terminal domain-containing protein [Hyphomicrobiales bacterium]|nr:CbiX/SirB N-terminal domain-containing protein [Kaistiaceae bacterium]HQF31155.1 CbiX/SirB N-terminal domain-containing protein [Hyphomicrobiales bacterium]